MKKKVLISLLLILFLLALVFFIVADVRPLWHLRKQTKVFKEYVTKVESKNLMGIHERLEMSTSEYQKLKEEVLCDWRDCAREIPLTSEFNPDENMFNEEERNGMLEAYSKRSGVKVPLHLSNNSCEESLIVMIHDDKVYLEYKADLQMGWLPFVLLH